MSRAIKYFSGSTNFRTSDIKVSTFKVLQTPDVTYDGTKMSNLSTAQVLVSDNKGKVLLLPTTSSRNYLYSDDYGYTWRPLQLPAAATISAGIYANNQWVILPTTGTTAYTSPDGITWTARTLASSLSWGAIAFQNGIYVAIAFNTSSYNTSPDGITWTSRSLPVSSTGQRYTLVGAGGYFVYSTNTNNTVYYSTDGINWTSASVLLGSAPSAVGYINGYFVVFGTSVATFGYSTTPTSWSTGSLPTSFNAGAIASGGGHLIAIGNSGQAYYTESGTSFTLVHNGNESAFGLTGVYACYDGKSSVLRTDGSNAGVVYRFDQSKYGGYQQRTLPATATWTNMIYGPSLGIWVAVVSNSTQAASSVDGITWTIRTLPSSQSWQHLAFGAGTFVVTGVTSAAAYSTNGTTWTSSTMTSAIQALVYGDKFVGVGVTACTTSPDGITWTSRTFPIIASGIAYGGGLYVAVGSSTAATSPDGITWTTRTFPLANANSVAYGNGVFIATSSSNNNFTVSYDGINWGPAVSYPQAWNSQASRITFVNDVFIIGGVNTNTYMTTVDGKSFRLHKNGLGTTFSSGRWAGDGLTFLMLPAGDVTVSIYQWDGRGTMVADASYVLNENRFTGADYEAIQFLNGEYMLGSAVTTDGGYTWTPVDINGSQAVAKRTAFNGTAYVCVNDSNQLFYSNNGRDWIRIQASATLSSPGTVLWDGTKFVLFPSSGTVGATSTDGKNWTTTTVISGSWTTAAYNGSNLYVAFQGGTATGTYMTSTNGTSWTSRTFPSTLFYHRSVVYVNGTFFVMSSQAPTGQSGMIFKSDDCITWTAIELPSAGVWISMYSANNALWMTTQRGLVVVTYDKGVTWSIVADFALSQSTTTILSMAVSDNGGEMMLIGTNGYISRLRIGQSIIYTVPAGRSAKVTFNYLKSTQDNLNFMMDDVPVWTAASAGSVAGTSVTDKPIYMGPGSKILANADLDYSFLAIEEY